MYQYTCEQWRVRSDNVVLNSTVFDYPPDTAPISWPVGVPQRVRFSLACWAYYPLEVRNADFRLVYWGDNGPVEITANSPRLRLVDSLQFVNGSSTSRILSTTGTPFVPGIGIDAPGAGTVSLDPSIPNPAWTEIEFCLEAYGPWYKGEVVQVDIFDGGLGGTAVTQRFNLWFGIIIDDGDRSGALNDTLGDIGLSASGQSTSPIVGSLDQGLDAVALVALGTVGATGAMSVNLDPVELTANGSVLITADLYEGWNIVQSLQADGTVFFPEVTGGLNVELDPVVLQSEVAVGHVPIVGDFAEVIEEITLNAAGGVGVSGSLDGQLDGVTLESDAGVVVGGEMYAIADDTFVEVFLTASAYLGAVPLFGELWGQLEDIALDAQGSCLIAGEMTEEISTLLQADGVSPLGGFAVLDATLEDFSLDAAGSVGIGGACGEQLPDWELDARCRQTTQPIIIGSLGQALDDITAEIDGVVDIQGESNNTLDEVELVCDGVLPIEGEADVTIDDVVLDGGSGVDLVGECGPSTFSFQLAARARQYTVPPRIGNLALAIDDITLEADGTKESNRRLAIII